MYLISFIFVVVEKMRVVVARCHTIFYAWATRKTTDSVLDSNYTQRAQANTNARANEDINTNVSLMRYAATVVYAWASHEITDLMVVEYEQYQSERVKEDIQD